jgi:hypothetical protein
MESTARFLLGFCLLALTLGLLSVASLRWCRVLLPQWRGAPISLATIVVAVAAIISTEELLGAFGWLRPLPTITILALLGLAGCLSERRNGRRRSVRLAKPESSTDQTRTVDPAQGPLWMRLVALGAVSIVAADWCTRTVGALHHGMSTPDTLWYHMPVAARFAQHGTITPLHFVDPGVDLGSVIPFYPANGELVHTLGILALGSDFLSVLLNLGWLAVALLAAWCVGRPYGLAPVSLSGCAVLMATPGLVATQPGGAYTDITGLALVLSAAALLVNGERRPLGPSTPTCIAALSAGLALGTKFTFVVPIVALTVGVVLITPRGARVRMAVSWVGLVVLTGGFWYGRNVGAIGNPLPSTIRLGPLHLMGPLQPQSSTVASFIAERSAWVHWYLPGFRASLGPVWWAVLVLAVCGIVAGALLRSSPVRRMLAFVGAVTAIGFVFTPQLLTLPPLYPHQPYNFVFNLRYSFAAVLLGLVLLPTIPFFGTQRIRKVLLVVYALIVALTQFDSTIWPIHLLSAHFGPAIGGIDSLIGLLLGILIFAIGAGAMFMRSRAPFRASNQRTTLTITAVAMAVIVLASMFGAEQVYVRSRYQALPPLQSLYTWAQSVSDARIGITGLFDNISYPLYGRTDSNYVQAIGVPGRNGSFALPANCRQFRRAVNGGNYTYVVTVGEGSPADTNSTGSNPTTWLANNATSHLILRRSSTAWHLIVSVFRMDGTLSSGQCLRS